MLTDFPRAACVIIVNQDLKVLLIHRDDTPEILFPGTWCLPGGSLLPEESALDGAMRECKEEIGLIPPGLNFFLTYRGEYHEETVYWAKMNLSESDVCLGEGQDFMFVSPNELDLYNCSFSVDLLIRLLFSSNKV